MEKKEDFVDDYDALAQIEEYNEDTLNEDFLDINLNKGYKPYRDKNNNNEDDGSGNDDNYSVTSCASTVMSANEVRSKVRKSLLSKMKTEKRRLKNKGESAMITARNRDIKDTIYLSTE